MDPMANAPPASSKILQGLNRQISNKEAYRMTCSTMDHGHDRFRTSVSIQGLPGRRTMLKV